MMSVLLRTSTTGDNHVPIRDDGGRSPLSPSSRDTWRTRRKSSRHTISRRTSFRNDDNNNDNNDDDDDITIALSRGVRPGSKTAPDGPEEALAAARRISSVQPPPVRRTQDRRSRSSRRLRSRRPRVYSHVFYRTVLSTASAAAAAVVVLH